MYRGPAIRPNTFTCQCQLRWGRVKHYNLRVEWPVVECGMLTRDDIVFGRRT